MFLNVKIDDKIHEKLKLFSVIKKVSMATIVQKAVVEYMEKHGKKEVL